jgi:hypothetical protein
MRRLGTLLLAILTWSLAAPAWAQTPAQRGRLIITVNDTTGGVLPTATVTLTGAEPSSRTAKLTPLQTTGAGIAIFDNLVPGQYLVSVEFPGFETLKPKAVRVRAGDNRDTVVLALARFEDTVTVGRDQQEAGSDRASTFGTLLTADQIGELSDDPAIMRQQLEDLAGPGMSIAVDSFEGGQLPNKSQIRSIRISRDQFAAESHYAGGTRIEIVTQPGSAELRGQASLPFQTSALDGKNPLVGATPAGHTRGGNIRLTGTLIKDRMSFNVSMNGSTTFTTPVQAASASSGTAARVLDIQSRNSNTSYSGGIDWAVTKNQTLRLSLNRYSFGSHNAGAGGYNAPERTSSNDNIDTWVQGNHTGPLGRRTMLYNRFYVEVVDSKTTSSLEAPTYVIPDDLTRGGAQQRGGTTTHAYSWNTDVDHVRGRHSFRLGVEVLGSSYRSDQQSNYLGTYYFESADAFVQGLPRSFTKRIGDPNIRYANTQTSLYFQDDVRLSKTLTMTPGVRYEVQSLVSDYNNLMPRFGVTWAPAGGKTTYRASVGVFYDWLSTGTYQQTLQFDGFRMQEVNIANPSYPEPGSLGPATPVQRYLLAEDLDLARTARASLGVSRTVNTMLSVSGVYAYTRAMGQLVGENLNAPVGGVRPDPTFANVIRATSDGRAAGHSLDASGSLNLAGLGSNPTVGPWFAWRRGLAISGNYGWGVSHNNTDGPFSVPATDLASEWGPANGDIRHRTSVSLRTAAIRGLSASIGLNRTSARPLTIRTGTDDNGDLIFNDRPMGVGRNSARVPGTFGSNASFGYTFSFGDRMVSNAGGVSITSVNGVLTANANQAPTPRYRLGFSVNIQNLLNRPQWNGYSGTLTSKNFLKPSSASGVRQIRMNVNLSF